MQAKDSNTPSINEIYRYLSGFYQEGGELWQKENDQYLHDHVYRFYKTLEVLPQGSHEEKLLELGSTPYFMSLILKRYFNYTLFLNVGVCVGSPEKLSMKLTKKSSSEESIFSLDVFNVEIDKFPYPDNSFDIVLCCELIEHLALDPTHMLKEMHRILKPGGRILITTPNVLVLRNLVSLVRDRKNIYYRYSGYGVYGRHNREWTLGELTELVSGCGFEIEKASIEDTYPHRGYSLWLKRFFPHLRDMLIVLARAKDEPGNNCYPDDLYESLPKQYDSDNPIPSILQSIDKKGR